MTLLDAGRMTSLELFDTPLPPTASEPFSLASGGLSLRPRDRRGGGGPTGLQNSRSALLEA